MRFSSVSMISGTLVSRSLGLFKIVLIGMALGATSGNGISDIFEVANNLPNILYILLAGGMFNVVLVPQMVKANKQADRGSDYLSRILTLGVVALAGITVLLTFIAGPLISLLTRDWSSAQLALGTQFAVWLIPQIFFYGLYAILGQILNSQGRFGSYMWAPALNNVVGIVGVIVFLMIWGNAAENPRTLELWTSQQTMLFAGVTTLGVALQALILFIPLHRMNLNLRFKLGWRGIGLLKTGKIAIWAIATMVIGQLSYLFISWVATAATGSKSDNSTNQDIAGQYVFNRASDIYILPHSVIVVSIATIFFNRIIHSLDSNDVNKTKELVSRMLRTTGAGTFFFASLLLVLAGQIGFLFSGGRPQSGVIIGVSIAILSVGSPFLSMNFMFNRVLYASEDARTPFYLQSALVVLGLAMAVAVSFLPENILIYSLLGTITVGNIVAPFLSGWVLRRKVGDFELARVVRTHVQFLVAAIISAIVGVLAVTALGGASFIGGKFDGFAWGSFPSALATIAVVVVLMAGVYWLCLKLMRNQELEALLAPLLGRFAGLTPKRRPTTSQVPPTGSMAPAEATGEGLVLQGRYRINETVIAAENGGSVYRGVDQLLRRPIFVLAAAPDAGRIIRSRMREFLTVEESSEALLILDLWTSGSATYLVAANTTSKELLYLIEPENHFIEPHFTEVLDLGPLQPWQR